MELDEIRREIDGINDEMLKLWDKRCTLTAEVADYKLAHGLPVFQAGRENEILTKMAEQSCGDKRGVRLLFSDIMDISKCAQQERITSAPPADYPSDFSASAEICCQGAAGSYSEAAAARLFPSVKPRFLPRFEDVFAEIESGGAEYGILPIENSSAGDVFQTFSLMAKFNLYIVRRVSVKIEHVLCARRSVPLDEIKCVYSHEQALRQCSEFIGRNRLTAVSDRNTAVAAKRVAENADNAENIAAICSRRCAELYGLTVLSDNIADYDDNYTRFICFSKKPIVTENADIISISLSLPHTAGALNKLLTRFSYAGLNLLKIESKPLPISELREDSFDVAFYFDISGNIRNSSVARLLQNLKNEMKYYKFLGNYEEIQ